MAPAKLDVTAVIPAPPRRVMKAFFDAETLHAWWKVSHSVTRRERLACTRSSVRRSISTTKFSAALAACSGDRGEMPGRRRFRRRRRVLAAAWRRADRSDGARRLAESRAWRATRVHVLQSGFEETPRWRRYYKVVGVGWESALASLKALLEH